MCGWGGRGCEGQSTVQDEGGGRPRAGGQGGREERGEDRAVFRWPRQPDQLHHDPLEDGAGAQGRSSAHSPSPPSPGAGTSWGRGAEGLLCGSSRSSRTHPASLGILSREEQVERRPSLPARTAKATWAPGFLLRRSFSPGVPQESLGMTAPGHVTGRARAGRRSRARGGREGREGQGRPNRSGIRIALEDLRAAGHERLWG